MVPPLIASWHDQTAGRNWRRSVQHPGEQRSVRSCSQSIRSSAKVRVLGLPQYESDRVGAVEAGEHQDVEQFGAGSGAEGVQAFLESALELIGTHPVSGLPPRTRRPGSATRLLEPR